MAAADDLAVLAELAEIQPLTPEEILGLTFDVSKHGLGKVTAEDLVAHVAGNRNLITSCDDKGWTPVLWASFHGHWQVCVPAIRRLPLHLVPVRGAHVLTSCRHLRCWS
jgi:hypothetical protein